MCDHEARRRDAEYVLADHLLTSEPLDDWAREELLVTGLVTEADLRFLPDPVPDDDPRSYWEYTGDRWDVQLEDGEPVLVERLPGDRDPPAADT